MEFDVEGFYHPSINPTLCINCGSCARACKQSDEAGNKRCQKAYVCQNKNDEILSKSSSGGIFYEIAKRILESAGVVYGVAMEADQAIHVRAEDELDLDKLLGSKYIQSNVSDIYTRVISDLKDGRKVLFSGTPCQIAALYTVIGKRRFQNLLCLDFICHGVPSPGIWKKYHQHIETQTGRTIQRVSFRDKTDGWENFALAFFDKNGLIESKINQNDPYMQLFLQNKILCKACFHCKHKGLHKHSDLTLADFWSTRDFFSKKRQKGISTVIVNSKSGEALISSVSNEIISKPISIYDAMVINRNALFSALHPWDRERTIRQLLQYGFCSYSNEMLKLVWRDKFKMRLIRGMQKAKTILYLKIITPKSL